MKNLPIYLISDSVGETAQKIITAVTVQFPTLQPFEIRRFPFVTEIELLQQILSEALQENGVVVHTLVNPALVAVVEKFSSETGLAYVDYMSPLTRLLHEKTGIIPLAQPGALHRLDEDYFSRVAAIEFAVKYDDGKDPKGFLQADYVILGISRTSKTPLSMYLANRGYKVANLPLLPEVPLPDEIFKVSKEKIIGLTTDAQELLRVRKSRLKALGLKEDTSYSDPQRIQQELAYATQLFKDLDVHVIKVDGRAIEETAAIIEEQDWLD